jgi:hypothetical protein
MTEAIRPTPIAERTLVGVAAGFCVQALLFGAFLLLPIWPEAAAARRIDYLGWALILSAVGNLIIVIGFMSPWIGSVKLTGLGAELDVNGHHDVPAPPAGQ